MLRKLTGLLPFLLVVLTIVPVRAQEILVRDTSLVVGKLENGLTYYIKNNGGETDRVFYSLIVQAGSMDEDDSQRGLAHFTEHLSFDGTPTYKQGLLDGSFLFKTSTKGFAINALTTETETVYTLTLPNLRGTLVDSALVLFRDWLFAEFNSEESITKQRGIIGKEWLEFQDVSERNRQQWRPAFFNNSKWAYRRPIGEIEIINEAPISEMARFRNEWYRPDLAALTIVGSVNVEECVGKIESLFSQTPTHKVYRQKEEVIIPDNETRNVIVTTDKEQQYAFLAIYHRRPSPAKNTKAWIHRSAQYSLINMMMVTRLTDAQEMNSDVVSYLGATMFSLMKPDWVYSPNASIVRGKERDAITVVAREQERIVQHGFLADELAQAKKSLMNRYQHALDNHSRSNVDWSKMLEAEFLTDYPAQTPSAEAKLYCEAIEAITLDDMNALHRELWNGRNSVVILTLPEADMTNAPTTEEIRELFSAVEREKMAPYKPVDVSRAVYQNRTFAEGGSVVKCESLLAEMPVKKYTLSNGAEVVCYHDSTRQGIIHFEAVSKGGKVRLKGDGAQLADLACQVYNQGPVDIYSLPLFRRYLKDARWQMNIAINNDTENIKGSVSTSQFETLLKRINLLFKDLSLTAEDYEATFQQQRQRMVAQQEDITFQNKRFVEDIRRGDGSKVKLSAEEMAQVELTTLESILRNRFASLSDFTFYFTGAVDQVDLEALVAKYLGEGKRQKREEWKRNSKAPLSGEETFILEAGADPRAVVTYVVGAEMTNDMQSMTLLQALTPILNNRLFGHIREELHLVYGITAQLNFKMSPQRRAEYEIAFQCDPKDVENICKEVNVVFEKIITQGPSDEEFARIKSSMLQGKRMYANDDNFRLGCIRSHNLYYSNDYTQQLNNIEFIERMSKEKVVAMFAQLYEHPKCTKTTFVLKQK